MLNGRYSRLFNITLSGAYPKLVNLKPYKLFIFISRFGVKNDIITS